MWCQSVRCPLFLPEINDIYFLNTLWERRMTSKEKDRANVSGQKGEGLKPKTPYYICHLTVKPYMSCFCNLETLSKANCSRIIYYCTLANYFGGKRWRTLGYQQCALTNQFQKHLISLNKPSPPNKHPPTRQALLSIKNPPPPRPPAFCKAYWYISV